jgi:hypothetical protein
MTRAVQQRRSGGAGEGVANNFRSDREYIIADHGYRWADYFEPHHAALNLAIPASIDCPAP